MGTESALSGVSLGNVGFAVVCGCNHRREVLCPARHLSTKFRTVCRPSASCWEFTSLSLLLPEPVPAEQNGPCAHTPASAAKSSPVASLLLLAILLAALVVLLARGMKLEEALAILGAGGLLAAELRQRLL